jgi:iron transport multicopper oxidase
MGQYPDGLRGPLVINDPGTPFKDLYDEELVLTVSDWYHDEMPGLLKFFMSRFNPTGAEPVPRSALLNETQNLQVKLQPGRRYLFRMINIGAFAGQYVWFEGHNVTILEIDGVYTRPTEASMIYLSAAQRYSFVITARDDSSANFPFMASMDTVRLSPGCWSWILLTLGSGSVRPAPRRFKLECDGMACVRLKEAPAGARGPV